MKRKVKVPVQYAWVGRAGSLPPPPAPLAEPWGGGGLASHVLPGDFEQGRGDLWQASRELKWQVFLASKFGGLFSRVNPAGCHCKLFWRVILKKKNRTRHSSGELVPQPADGDPVSGRGIKMMMATEVEKASAL